MHWVAVWTAESAPLLSSLHIALISRCRSSAGRRSLVLAAPPPTSALWTTPSLGSSVTPGSHTQGLCTGITPRAMSVGEEN